MLVVVFSIATIVGVSWYYINSRLKNKCFDGICGPPALPFFGNAFDLSSPVEIPQKMLEYSKKYGGFFKVYMGTLPVLVMSDIKSVEWLLSSNKHIEKSFQYDFFKNWLGSGVFVAPGKLWRKYRKIIITAFHVKILEDFIPIFNSASDVLVNQLRKEIGNSSLDVHPIISLCALDIICETTMGVRINAQENSDSTYVKAVKEINRIIVERVITLKSFNFIYKFSRDYWKERRCVKILHEFSQKIIQNRKNIFEQNKKKGISHNETVDEFGRKNKMALLDLLLQQKESSRNALTDEELRDEVDNFVFGGHDTTASAMSFVLYNLSIHQEIQQKVIDELDLIFSENPLRQPTLQHLQDMKYLEMVIKESLRLYPTGPVLGRKLVEDDTILGHKIPKGTTILVLAYAIHNNPDIYPQPEKFIPERHDGRHKLPLPSAYIPFSAGPRNCIGQKYAMLEMKAVISKVLRNYKLLPAIPYHELMLSIETILTSVNGIRLRLQERKRVV